MKISELKDRQGNINMDLRIIWDKSNVEEKFGKKIKSVIVKDVDGDENSPTAYMDMYNEYAEKFRFGDKIRITDGYAKLINNGKGQFRLTNIKRIEMIEDEKDT